MQQRRYGRGLRGNDNDKITYCLGRLRDSVSRSSGYRMSHWTFLLLVQALKSKQRLAIHKALQFLGEVFLAQGRRQTAAALFAIALDGFVQMDVHRNRGECMLCLADLSAQDGGLPNSIELWSGVSRTQITVADVRLASIRQNTTEGQ
ncbi:hypothetical protein B0H13DRAFT_1882188 [Mycena leptocephala]|nr:hypothetical protein B0H13DRAFT_1882188 [Mycena leptocephala]